MQLDDHDPDVRYPIGAGSEEAVFRSFNVNFGARIKDDRRLPADEISLARVRTEFH